MAVAGRLANLQDAFQAEAMACVEALTKASYFGMGRIILESDAHKLSSTD